MASSNFISKLNWRLIIIHTIACGFFIYGFKVFVYLHDHDFWFRMETADLTSVSIKRITTNLRLGTYSGFAGLFVGFIISLIVSLVRKWYWLNPVIVLLLSFSLLQYNLYGWGFLKHIFLLPGSVFSDYTKYIITNGMVLLLIGGLLFFLKPVAKFINAGQVK